MKSLLHALVLGATLTMACSDGSAPTEPRCRPHFRPRSGPRRWREPAPRHQQEPLCRRRCGCRHRRARHTRPLGRHSRADRGNPDPAGHRFSDPAGAIADEIAENKPDVVGLQEVFTLNLDLTALGLPVVINLPFLDVLMQQLDARGLHYTVATHLTTTQASPIPGISLTDADAILVNADRVLVGSTFAKIFDYNIGTVAPGVTILRGWTTAQVTATARATRRSTPTSIRRRPGTRPAARGPGPGDRPRPRHRCTGGHDG